MMWQMLKYAAFALALGIALSAVAQAPLAIYTDNLVNGFQDRSWAARNLSNTSPTHSGSNSISVTPTARTALSFQHSDFNATPTLFAFAPAAARFLPRSCCRKSICLPT